MNKFAQILTLSLSLTGAVIAGPVQKDEVAGDAKWLVHLDLEGFRGTKVGDFMVKEIIDKQLERPVADLKRKFQFDLDPGKIMEKINSVTVYGTDFKSPEQNAVLLVKVHPDLQTILVGALSGMSLADTNSAVIVQQTPQGPISIYSMQGEIFFAVLPGKVVAVGKTREVIQKAADVLAGKVESLKSGKAFSEFKDVNKSFFFLGVAEGFSTDEVSGPQAKLLQMADGGRVVLGENSDQLFLNLALKGKTVDVAQQMQQVVQGLIALASLGQAENKDLAQLIQSVKVSLDNKIVSLNVDFPVDKAIQALNAQTQRMGMNGNMRGQTDPSNPGSTDQKPEAQPEKKND